MRWRVLAVLPACGLAALLGPAGAAGGSVTLGPVVRVTTPGASNCPAEGEPDVTYTKAGTWVGYNDDHDCLYPVVSTLTRLTTVQLLPPKGPAKVVGLTPLNPGDFYSGDPALAPDVSGDGVLLATLYGWSGGGTTIEVFRISPSLKVTHLPSPAVHPKNQASDDKEFIATDTGRSSRYRGRAYLVWDDFASGGDVVFRAFTGRGWTNAVTLQEGAGKADVAVAPNGTVAVAYESPQGVSVAISRNGGISFGDPSLAIAGDEPGRTDPACPLRPTVGTRQRATKAVRAAYDSAGRLHVVAAVHPSSTPSVGVATGGESVVVHAVSKNGEDFDTAPVGESSAVRFHPAVAGTPSGGVAVAWLQVADATSATYDAYVAVAAKGSRSFGTPVKLSPAPAIFPSAMEAMLNADCYGIGDYIGLATTARGVVAAWPTTDDKTRPQVDSDVLVREAVLR